MAGTMRLLALGLLWFLLAASQWLSCDAGETENREIRGYKHSGRFWPKTILWPGIRSSPGVLWFFFFFFVMATTYAWILLLFDVATSGVKESPESETATKVVGEVRGGLEALMQAQLATGLLYVSLSVTQLSDAMEAYLVGLCSIQLLLDAGRPRKPDNVFAAFVTLLAFVTSAVLAIAMLDSFRALNVLNVCYSTVGVVPIMISLCLAPLRPGNGAKKIFGFIASLWHFAFLIAAFLVAEGVKGTHRSPMLTFLCVSGINLLLVTLAHLCIGGK